MVSVPWAPLYNNSLDRGQWVGGRRS